MLLIAYYFELAPLGCRLSLSPGEPELGGKHRSMHRGNAGSGRVGGFPGFKYQKDSNPFLYCNSNRGTANLPANYGKLK